MKQLIMLMAGALLISSCSERPNSAADETASNEKIARQVFEKFNEQKWEEMAALYAEDADYLDPEFGTGFVKRTRKETADKYREMYAYVPDLRDSVTGVYPSGDKVTVEFTAMGTIDGQAFRLPICTVFTIRNKQIVSDATYYDLEQ